MATRRGHNEGSIQKVKDKVGKVVAYRPHVTVPGIGRRSLERFKTKAEAQRRLDEAKAEILQGSLRVRQSQKVSDYLGAWLSTLEQTGAVRPRTLEAYSLNVRRLSPLLGGVRLDSLTATHVQGYYNALLEKGLSARTVRQVHMTFHKALSDAIRSDLLTRNVTERVTLPRVPNRDIQTLTSAQLQQLWAATEGDRFHTLWVLLGTTGLRLGEAMALRYGDIDFDRRKLSVRRALQRQRGGKGLVFVEPKSATSRRTIDITCMLTDALRKHQEREVFRLRGTSRVLGSDDLLFGTIHGDPMAPEHVKRHLDSACEKAELPHITPHRLRHGSATIMLHELGLPVKLVSEMLGHSGIGITLATYTHVLPGMHRLAADRLDELLEGRRKA